MADFNFILKLPPNSWRDSISRPTRNSGALGGRRRRHCARAGLLTICFLAGSVIPFQVFWL
jgi:hypothetical protein